MSSGSLKFSLINYTPYKLPEVLNILAILRPILLNYCPAMKKAVNLV